MVDLVITDTARVPLDSIEDYELDLAYGADENDFTLSFVERKPGFGAKSLVGIEGTDYGGIVDGPKVSTGGESATVVWQGTTWHGMLGQRVLSPDSGQDYLTVSGEANTVLGTLVKRIGLNDLFTASAEDSGVTITNYQFDRYTDGYTGIRKMLSAASAKLKIVYADNQVTVSAERMESIEDTVDSDVMDFTVTKNSRRVNHLIGLGEGELKARAVSHWYADKDGNVSQTQSLKGLDEVQVTYDYSNAKADELSDSTKKKLLELQAEGDIEITIHDDHSFDVGDQVVGRDNVTGTIVSAIIGKKIIKHSKGVLSVSYEAGTDATSISLSGSAESSAGGGRVYRAGEGLTLAGDGITFFADVTQAKLDAVSVVANAANKTASDMSSTVGSLSNTVSSQDKRITTAQTTADKGVGDAAAAQAAADHAQETADSNTASIATVKTLAVTAQTTADTADSKAVNAQDSADEALHSGMNLLENPGFENGAKGWVFSGSVQVVEDESRSGSHSVRFVQNTRYPELIMGTPLHVASGRTLRFSFWAKTASAGNVRSFSKYVYLSNNGTDFWILNVDAAAPDFPNLTEEWQQYSLDFTPSSMGVSWVKFRLALWDGVADAFVDDLRVEDITDRLSLQADIESARYTLPTATTSVLGGVKPDGHTITVTSDGVLTAHSDNEAASFLAAYPIGSIYSSTKSTNPGTAYGGTWVPLPSLGGFMWERTA